MALFKLETNFTNWTRGVAGSLQGQDFPWRIKVEVTEGEDEGVAAEVRGPGPGPGEESGFASVNQLIAAGTYKKALEILNRVLEENPNHVETAEMVGKLNNWLEIKKQVTEKIKETDYEIAIERLEKLTLSVPAGAGKKKVLEELEELKGKWANKIEILREKLGRTKDLKKKNAILEKLLKIVPANEKAQISGEIEENIGKIERNRTRALRRSRNFAIFLLTAAILAVLALILFLKVIPAARCRSQFRAIEEKIQRDPNAALELIQRVRGACDSEKVLELAEKAKYHIRLKKSEIFTAEVFQYADKNDFEQAFAVFEKVKDLWIGLPLPGSIKEKEKELRTRASGYYLEKASDKDAEPGERFIYYDSAYHYSFNDRDILEKMNRYLKEKRNTILWSLFKKARDESGCARAKYLIKLCMRIKPSDPQVLALNEKIYQRCK